MNILVERQMGHSAQSVWALLSNFYEMPWNDPYSRKIQTRGSGIGMIREITLPTREEPLVERLEVLDETERRMAFSIISGMAAPISDFLVSAQVIPQSDSCCQVRIDISFTLDEERGDPSDLAYILNYSYDEALQRLEQYLDSAASGQ